MASQQRVLAFHSGPHFSDVTRIKKGTCGVFAGAYFIATR
jgi:hypothetical protein